MRLVQTVRDKLSRRVPNHVNIPIWEGVYQSFADVPSFGGFGRDNWITPVRAETVAALQEARAHHITSSAPSGDRALLPLLVALLMQHHAPVRILDWGGGLGLSYAHVIGALLDASRVEYHIVELPELVAEGRLMQEDHDSIMFHESVPAGVAFDIVYVSTALQYVNDYETLIRDLAAVGSPYLFLQRLSAGPIPTFATAQRNLAGSSIPYWFINIHELVALLVRCGYYLVFRSASDMIRDQAALPADHRLEHTVNLLFSRSA